MTTEAQVAANRLNAQKSTGPRTPEGKAAVALNAVTHGLRGQTVVLPGEDRDEWSRYHESMVGEMHPEGRQEVDLAERIVGLSWRLRRAGRYESAVFDALYEQQAAEMAQEAPEEAQESYTSNQVLGQMLVADFSGPRVLERVQLYEGRIERSLFRAWDEWDRLRAQPRLSDIHKVHHVPTAPTPDGVTTNRPGSPLCQTKPIAPEPAASKGVSGTNKPNLAGPAAGKHAVMNKQSQWQPSALSGLGFGGANKANFGAPLDVLGMLAAHKRLPRQYAM